MGTWLSDGKHRAQLGALLGGLTTGLLSSSVAAQEQFVLVDATFTATAQNTKESEFPMMPLPAAPASWKAPFDYTSGSAHLELEVLEKPSDVKTKFAVCFENTSGTYACMGYLQPDYTEPGKFTSDKKLSTFWQYSVYDWAQKVQAVYAVLKDENQDLVQGDPAFYPSKMHVRLTIVPAGKSFVEPTDQGEEEGDAGTPVAPPAQSEGGRPASEPPAPAAGTPAVTPPAAPSVAGSAGSRPTAVTPGLANAGTGQAGTTGSAGRPATAPLQDAGVSQDIKDYIDPGSSCSVTTPRGHVSGHAIAMLALLLSGGVLRRRRRAACSTRAVLGG
ncbi:MAG: hypothetical protein ABW321_26455 [Polyangiales bacterium]